MAAPCKFWMVWSPQGNAPVKRYNNTRSADREARRLALEHPTQNFYTLEACDSYRADSVGPGAAPSRVIVKGLPMFNPYRDPDAPAPISSTATSLAVVEEEVPAA